MPGSKSAEIRERLAEREIQADLLAAQAGELRLSGFSYRAIGEHLKCSPSSAYQAYKRFRKSLIRGDIEAERNLLLGRLEKQYRQLASNLAAADVKAHAVGVQIIELMSVIGGYQAPAQVEVKGGPPVTRIEFVEVAIAEQPDPWLEGQARDGRVPLLKPAEVNEPLEVK